MKTTVYMGLSVDGFVARPDDGLDFLPPPVEGDVDRFAAFLSTVDVIVMGRRTFEICKGFDWMYGQTPLIVLSSRDPAPLLAGAPPTVSVRSGDPATLLAELRAQGVGRVYVDGATLVRACLQQGLVDELVLTWVPVLIGAGISPFGSLPADVKLELRESRVLPGGMVQGHYVVLR